MGTPNHSARLESIQPMGTNPQSSRHLSMVSELKKYVSTYTRTLLGAPGCRVLVGGDLIWLLFTSSCVGEDVVAPYEPFPPRRALRSSVTAAGAAACTSCRFTAAILSHSAGCDAAGRCAAASAPPTARHFQNETIYKYFSSCFKLLTGHLTVYVSSVFVYQHQ